MGPAKEEGKGFCVCSSHPITIVVYSDLWEAFDQEGVWEFREFWPGMCPASDLGGGQRMKVLAWQGQGQGQAPSPADLVKPAAAELWKGHADMVTHQ